MCVLGEPHAVLQALAHPEVRRVGAWEGDVLAIRAHRGEVAEAGGQGHRHRLTGLDVHALEPEERLGHRGEWMRW